MVLKVSIFFCKERDYSKGLKILRDMGRNKIRQKTGLLKVRESEVSDEIKSQGIMSRR